MLQSSWLSLGVLLAWGALPVVPLCPPRVWHLPKPCPDLGNARGKPCTCVLPHVRVSKDLSEGFYPFPVHFILSQSILSFPILSFPILILSHFDPFPMQAVESLCALIPTLVKVQENRNSKIENRLTNYLKPQHGPALGGFEGTEVPCH